ncbi:MAG: methylated-DNA--[protein]-cysteine S-methyltransferase [Polyangiaceae bacterium]
MPKAARAGRDAREPTRPAKGGRGRGSSAPELSACSFPTAIGDCALVWSDAGVVGFQLPEATPTLTFETLRQRFPAAIIVEPPDVLARVIDGVTRLLAGEAVDLSQTPLDLSGVPPFHRRVYEVARHIPSGTTRSYGELAREVGSPGASRAVGRAMGQNPIAVIVPCHRVTAAGGKLGGFSAHGGVQTKQRLLEIERAAGLELPFDGGAARKHLRKADPVLRVLIDRVGDFALRPRPTPSVFRALARAIVYQQLSAKAAGTIHGRLCDACTKPRDGEHGLEPERLLKLSNEQLAAAGISQNKRLALQDLARRAVDGRLPDFETAQALADEALIEELTQVRGIGRWSAQMFLIFHLGRPDVLPTDDLSVRKAFGLVFGVREPSAAMLEAHGERWKPYRSVASWYLWQALDRQLYPE